MKNIMYHAFCSKIKNSCGVNMSNKNNNKNMVGIITMGSSNPLTKYNDIIDIFKPEVDVMFKGLTDGYIYEEITDKFYPTDNEEFIVSQIENKQDIKISQKNAIKLVEQRTKEFIELGIKNIIILCTGSFVKIETEGTFVIPERLIHGILKGLRVKKIGVLVPEKDQIPSAMKQYSEFNAIIKSASPYGLIDEISEKAKEFKAEEVDVILADCMGFTEYMGCKIRDASGKSVLIPRTLIPNIIKSILK